LEEVPLLLHENAYNSDEIVRSLNSYQHPDEWDEVDLGWGDQRHNRIGDVAYDRENSILYVRELYADDAKPIVHVWQIVDLLFTNRVSHLFRFLAGGE
jgi:hypothetical protein